MVNNNAEAKPKMIEISIFFGWDHGQKNLKRSIGTTAIGPNSLFSGLVWRTKSVCFKINGQLLFSDGTIYHSVLRTPKPKFGSSHQGPPKEHLQQQSFRTLFES